jgi:type III secretion protein V
VIVVLIVTALGAMILPITPLIADVLIATNISFSVLLLMVAFYVRSAVEFTSLPAIILISTVFRLSISIASTRLILIEADGGRIIQTFGDFVISGNVVVGLVVFLIITIVQFVVITKGSERVAEVAARFSLDGLPGKQMSIDSDLRSGDIDQAEARRRRQLLERESQLYGAMDGAMKFVKGDAIAGIIIIVVNLFGGMAIGTMQRGLSFNESSHVFSLLSVGEGLIAQIPALFVSLTAGTTVTRVTNTAGLNLGSDIISQIGAQPEALRLAGFVLLGLSLIPGFPTGVFLALAILLGGMGFLLGRREKERAEQAAPVLARLMNAEISTLLPARAGAPVTVSVSQSLFDALKHENMEYRLRLIAYNVSHDLGLATPGMGYRLESLAEPSRYMIEVDLVPEIIRDLGTEELFLQPYHAQALSEREIPFRSMKQKAGQEMLAAGISFRTSLESASLPYLTVSQLLESDLLSVLKQNAAHFVGIQETRRLLMAMEGDYKDLLREAQRVATIQRISDVLKRLLEEGVSIRNMRLILEAIIEWAPREQDTLNLTMHVRSALKRQISFKAGGLDKVIPAILVQPEAEDLLRKAAQQAQARNLQSIDPDISNNFAESLRAQLASLDEPSSVNAVILVSADLRRLIWSTLRRAGLFHPVLSYQEIAPDFSVRALATIRVPFAADGSLPPPSDPHRVPGLATNSSMDRVLEGRANA